MKDIPVFINSFNCHLCTISSLEVFTKQVLKTQNSRKVSQKYSGGGKKKNQEASKAFLQNRCNIQFSAILNSNIPHWGVQRGKPAPKPGHVLNLKRNKEGSPPSKAAATPRPYPKVLNADWSKCTGFLSLLKPSCGLQGLPSLLVFSQSPGFRTGAGFLNNNNSSISAHQSKYSE